MQTLHLLLEDYAASHAHPVNKLIHSVCVPAILWSVIALLWSLPVPASLHSEVVPVNWATVALVIAQVYYFRLSVQLGTGVLLFNLLLLWLTAMLESAAIWPLWLLALMVFVPAWIGQFIGHSIEGKKPAFFRDLQFLLIGPAWLMSYVYKQLGLRY